MESLNSKFVHEQFQIVQWNQQYSILDLLLLHCQLLTHEPVLPVKQYQMLHLCI